MKKQPRWIPLIFFSDCVADMESATSYASAFDRDERPPGAYQESFSDADNPTMNPAASSTRLHPSGRPAWDSSQSLMELIEGAQYYRCALELACLEPPSLSTGATLARTGRPHRCPGSTKQRLGVARGLQAGRCFCHRRRLIRQHPGKGKAGVRQTRPPRKRTRRRRKFLERNRQAASKCRQRKKEYMTELESQRLELETKNATLQLELNALAEEVSLFRNQLMSHANCDDANISTWLENEARKAAQEAHSPYGPSPVHSRHRSIASVGSAYEAFGAVPRRTSIAFSHGGCPCA